MHNIDDVETTISLDLGEFTQLSQELEELDLGDTVALANSIHRFTTLMNSVDMPTPLYDIGMLINHMHSYHN